MPAEVGRLSAAFPDDVHHDHRTAISARAFLLGIVWKREQNDLLHYQHLVAVPLLAAINWGISPLCV
jgi:hypothetical protein